MQVFNNDSIMPYGDYEGLEMRYVPDHYLEWIWDNNRCNNEVKHYIMMYRPNVIKNVIEPTPYSSKGRIFRRPLMHERTKVIGSIPKQNITQDIDERWLGPVEEFAKRYKLTWREAKDAMDFLNMQV